MKPIKTMWESLTAFHAAVNAANTQYAERAKALESFAGSKGYDSDMRDAQQIAGMAISDARNNLYTATHEALAAASEKLEKIAASTAAPTTDELNTLTALKLLSKPTKENIQDAAAVARNPLCIEALREIMSANGITGVKLHSNGMSVTEAREMLKRIYDNVREAAAQTFLAESPQDMISNRRYMAFELRNDCSKIEEFVSVAAHDVDLEECKQLVSMIDG